MHATIRPAIVGTGFFTAWANLIVRLDAVATPLQLAAARAILADPDAVPADGVPPGPTISNLFTMLAEHEEAVRAESEDAGHPDTWPAWTDADRWAPSDN